MAFNFKQGTYTGNGSTTQAVTGVGFTPKVVIIFAAGESGSGDHPNSFFKTTDMPSGTTTIAQNIGNNGRQSGDINSIDADGFTVAGGSKNDNTVVYGYVAFGGSEVATGTYTGNATDNRAFTGLGFSPGMVWIGIGNHYAMYKTSAMSGEVTQRGLGNIADTATNDIQSLDADGFTIGSSVFVNNSGDTAYWWAIKNDTSFFKAGSYTGNGSDARAITGVGFAPQLVFVKNVGGVQGGAKTTSLAGDATYCMLSGAPATNRIESLDADGFTIGTDSVVNTNTTGYYYFAVKSGASVSAIKTSNGNTIATVKTYDAVANASVKTWNTVPNV